MGKLKWSLRLFNASFYRLKKIFIFHGGLNSLFVVDLLVHCIILAKPCSWSVRTVSFGLVGAGNDKDVDLGRFGEVPLEFGSETEPDEGG